MLIILALFLIGIILGKNLCDSTIIRSAVIMANAKQDCYKQCTYNKV